MALGKGTQLGPYEIVAPLGAGGMGEVYRARDTRLGREVAVKVLPPEFATDADRLRRFELEARTTGMLSHPNILAVYDIGKHDGAPYLVTELLDGSTLREQLPVSRRKALEYARQAAQGLAAAHAKGVTHRDLKPENLFVTSDGRVKILDFGLAKVAEDVANTATAVTAPGVALGTVGYMSPEQARGKAADHRSDIFSLGAILYEVLSGRRAFQRDSAVETMTAIIKEDPPPLPDAALERVVRRCLEKSPEERFQSASDLAFAIETLSGGSSSAQSGVGVAVAAPARGKFLLWAAAVIFTLIAGTVLGMWLQNKRTPAAPIWTGTQLGGSNIAFGPRVSPDGKMIAFLAMVDGLTQVGVMDPVSSNWTVLTHARNSGMVNTMSWSRDGSKIYFDRFDPLPLGIYSIPALGGEERLILEDAIGPEVLPDGSLLLARLNAQRALQLHHYWPETGRVEALNAFLISSFSAAPRAFPDGKSVLFFGNPAKLEPPFGLHVLDLVTGRSRPLAPEVKGIGTAGLGFASFAIGPGGQSVFATVPSGDLIRLIKVPADGKGPAETLFSLTASALFLDAGLDGSLYVDQLDRRYEVLRLPASGGALEHLASSRRVLSGGNPLLLPDGRVVYISSFAGRNQLVAARPGKDPTPFAETQEETSTPIALVGGREVAFLLGRDTQRMIALASVTDGRIVRRLAPTQGALVNSLTAAPDGKTLYYTASLGNIWSISAEGGEPRKIGIGDGVTADPGGKELIVIRVEREGVRLLRLPVAGGPESPIPFSSELRLSGFGPEAINKDGRMVVFVTARDSWYNTLAILDLRSGKVEPIHTSYDGDLANAGWTSDGRIITSGFPMRASIWRFRPETK